MNRIFLTLVGAILFVSAFVTINGLYSQTHAAYGVDVQFTNKTNQEVVVTITGATSYFLFESDEWAELGITKPGFYKYPNQEIRLQKGETSGWIKQWRIKQASVRYGGYKSGKSVLLGYSPLDNYIDFLKIWQTEGHATVTIEPKAPSSYIGSWTGVSMTLKFTYTYGRNPAGTSNSKNGHSNTNNNQSSSSSNSSSNTNNQSNYNNTNNSSHRARNSTGIPAKLRNIYSKLGITSSNPTPYDILGISEDAEASSVKKAYRKLCVKWHPDKFAGKPDAEQKTATEVFQVINNANDYINDELSKVSVK